MADAKVSAFTALAAAPAVGDLVPVIDISDTTQGAGGTAKKVTVAELFTSPTLVTPVLGEATGTGVTLSGLTASEIVITNGSKKLVSAAVATYPSLTELTYLKGVTSAIQTQLDAKQAADADLTTIAGLTATTDNFIQSKSSAWASRTPTQVTADLIAVVGDSGSGGTKGLVPAPAAGDAAAGKFLKADGTWAVAAGSGDVSKVGTPVNNQIGVWTGDGTLEGDASLTFDTTTDTLSVAASGKIAMGAVNIIDDTAGTTTLSNIDALDATTESTLEAAIDTLANLTSIQGRTVTLADAGANAVFGWDDVAGAYENLTASEVRGAVGLATSDSPQFTGIELGHATDTTLSRVSAGVVAIEGSNILTAASGANLFKRQMEFIIGDGTNVITTGEKKTARVQVPVAGTITSWTLLSLDDTSGSITLDIWKDTYANYPPTVADTITAAAKPAISSATKNTSSTLTGWTTSLTAGDILSVNVDSVTSLKAVKLVLAYTVT